MPTKKHDKILWAIVIVLIIALILVHCFRIRPYNERSSDMIYVAIDSTKDAINSILGAMREYEQINTNFSEYIKDIAFAPAPKQKQIANIVLIIGESVQRNKMQVYGYDLPNTPIFSEIYTKGTQKGAQNLFVYDDVISAQIATYESLSQVLTFANQDDLSKKWFEYLNIVDAMKLGGYKSAVISNQERFSLWSKATTTIFSRADELHWSSDSVAGKRLDSMGFDENILPILDSVLATNAKSNAHSPLFLTLHLMGSHVGYANRYPKHYEKFSARDVVEDKKSHAKADLAQYANSILYTDFVVGEIIKRFADSDSIVIYVSDHANDVWDTGEGSLRVDSKITRFMVEVPFVVYVSDRFRELHPTLYARIAQSTQKPFMIDDLIHALIDIAGFQIDGYESARSIFSDDFDTLRARMVGTQANVDYDEELR
ncbi:phosphoethanolamine transferase [Helicobacter himalayensis]|uniref:phosphoethanolamine transferase n=1 Tax=Helicobacter himalayensis TaxID=1591088 RepID=UPI003D6E1568